MQKIPVSCFIIAVNEGDRIARTITSVKDLVDDIVVIDSGSSDDTIAVAQALGCRTLHNDWRGFGPQKRFGEDQCRHDMVLNLDADEVVLPDLREEMRRLFDNGRPRASFFRFKLLTVYPGADKPRPYADYHNYIRLYDRTKGRFSPSPVHDLVDPGGHEVVQLSGVAWHYSYRSLSHLIAKLNSYTDLQARTARKGGALFGVRLLAEFPLSFFKYYVLRRHITGGLRGFVFAFAYSAFKVFRLAKMGRIA